MKPHAFLVLVVLAFVLSCQRYNDTPAPEPQKSSRSADEDVDDEIVDRNMNNGTSQGSGDQTDGNGDPNEHPTDLDVGSGKDSSSNPNPKGDGSSGDQDPASGSDKPVGEHIKAFSEVDLLWNLGHNITYGNIVNFISQGHELRKAVDGYCLDPNADFSDIQQNWRSTMNAWQSLEMAKFGPIADDAGRLRNAVYSWDLVAAKYHVFREVYQADGDSFELPSDEIYSGLDAIEAIVFEADQIPVCARRFARLPADWKNLELSLKHDRSCRYLRLAVDDLLSHAAEIRAAWHPDMGNYGAKLVGDGSHDQLKRSLNKVTDAMAYLETSVKDKKIGIPAHQSPDICDDESCACRVEHLYSGQSGSAIERNLRSFRNYYLGTPEVELVSTKKEAVGVGIDDYLVEKGFEDLAKKFEQRIDVALDHLNRLNGKNLYELATEFDATACQETSSDDRKDELCAIYLDFQGISGMFRNDLLPALNLSAPETGAGDGD